MKAYRLALLLLILLLLVNTAVAQQSVSNTATGAATSTNSATDEIRTLDGVTYKSARDVKILSDGIMINYTPSGGGIGMIKIAFENLPDYLQQKYFGYTTSKPSIEIQELVKRAESGDAKAQYDLGMDYYIGQSVRQDLTEAIKWLRKSSDQGNVEAANILAGRYANGEGVTKNPVEATRLLRKTAEQGNAVGQRELGGRYWAGEGVVKDDVEAAKWYNLAASQGDELAKQLLPQIEQEMTSEQIAGAQQLAREFKLRKKSGSNNSASPNSPTASGTGFFITDDGYLISNYHVVKAATKVRLVTSAGTIDAKVIQVDAANDLALLKADGKFSPLPIAASRAAHLGGTVATIGFPDPSLQGFSPKLAKGEIASLSGAGDDPRYFQISVPVQPGNSGGALVDGRGNVIGIVSAKLDASTALAMSGSLPENVNYAVKSSLLLSFLESVPAVSAKLKAPVTADRKFEDVVKSAQDAAVLVLVY